jgi:hypothetical protein
VEREGGHWQARLPAELVEPVVWPVRMQAFHDDAVPASKWRGYDALGLLCCYRHVYSRWSADFDDVGGDAGGSGQVPCELEQQEELEARRTLLGTWVRRVQRMRRADGAGSGADEGALFDTGFELVTARSIPRL